MARWTKGGLDIANTWYPDGGFALLVAGAYVGLAAGAAWRLLHVALSAVLALDAYWVHSLPIGNAGPGRGIVGETAYSAAGIYVTSMP